MEGKRIFIKQYVSDLSIEWNEFNASAKNGLFLFDRNYMEYHSDRFKDNSLLFYYDNRLVAILPANIFKETFYSHQGLTYGGFIVDAGMKQHIMNDCFTALIEYLREHNIKYMLYKTIPHIFHKIHSEEDKYSLFINNSFIEKVEASTAIDLLFPLKMTKGRKAQISRAKREEIFIDESTDDRDYKEFFVLEEYVLKKYHNTVPVHTADEMILLHRRFPEHIHLYTAKSHQKIVAGIILYEYENSIHTQYMAADEDGRKNGALDLIIASIIDIYKHRKRWLDFGISTEHGGNVLNGGLISQKESFGGRTIVYETYGVKIDEKY